MLRLQVVNWEKHQPRNDYKSLPWIKLQTDFYRHKKLHGCDRDTRLLLIDLFCLAGEENKQGVIEGDMAWLSDTLKLDTARLEAGLKYLQDRGLIQDVTNAPRTARVRQTYGSRTPSVRVTNAPRTLRKITEDNVTERNGTGERVAPTPRDLASLWNANAGPDQPKVDLTLFESGTERWRMAQARLEKLPDLTAWEGAIKRVAASAFCNGGNDRGWYADFTFLVRGETYAKILEGKYDERASKKKSGAQRALGFQRDTNPDDEIAAMEERVRQQLATEEKTSGA